MIEVILWLPGPPASEAKTWREEFPERVIQVQLPQVPSVGDRVDVPERPTYRVVAVHWPLRSLRTRRADTGKALFQEATLDHAPVLHLQDIGAQTGHGH